MHLRFFLLSHFLPKGSLGKNAVLGLAITHCIDEVVGFNGRSSLCFAKAKVLKLMNKRIEF